MPTGAPGMQAEFRLHAVGPPLDRHVAGIWAVSGAVPVTAETVLPNGVVELIFNLGPPHRVVEGHGDDATVDRWYRRAWLAGMQQGPLSATWRPHPASPPWPTTSGSATSTSSAGSTRTSA